MVPYVAAKYFASSSNAQVIGQVMQAFLDNIHIEQIEPILRRHGLSEIHPDKWYAQQHFASLYRELAEENDVSLVAIGVQTIETLNFPPEVNSIPSALQALQSLYQRIHRNIPTEEGWNITELEEGRIRVDFNSPYADEAAYGYLYAIAQRFCPKGHEFAVRPIEDLGMQGPTQFEVAWWKSN